MPATLAQPAYKNIFKALPGSFLVLSPDSIILEVSEHYRKATHTLVKDIVGASLLDTFPENPDIEHLKSREAIRNSLQQVVTLKSPHTLDAIRYDILTPDGNFEERYWTLRSVPVLDGLGEVEFIVHEVQDITAQVMKKQEVNAAHNSLWVVAKSAGGIVWEANLLENKLTWSETYKDVLGYGDEDLEATLDSWDKHVHPEDLPGVRKSIRAAIGSMKKLWVGEYRYRKANGSYTSLIDYGYIIYDDTTQKPVRLLGTMVDVGRQKDYELKLLDMNQRFQRIAMATNDVIWDWNLKDDSIWWNEGFKTLFGYAEEDIEDTVVSWTSRIHPDDLATTKASIYSVINSGGTSWEGEYSFRCADGTYKLVRDRGFVMRDEQGEPQRMVGAMIDITIQKRTQQQLQESMSHTTQLLESLPLMTWTALPNGDLNYYSQRWYDYTGSTFEIMQDWGWSKLIHPEDLEETTKQWLNSLSTGQDLVLENRFRSSKGVYRWFLVRAVPIRNAEGQVTMWVGSHTDIEEQKQLLLALEESNSKFKLLAESIPHIVWSGEPDGHVDFFNQQWYDYTRMSEEETLGFGWAPSLHPDDLQATIDDWISAIKTGEKYERELRLRDIYTENYRWFLARALPQRNADGQIVKWFGTATDIHDQKMLREQVEESERQFRFLSESIPQMVWTATPEGVTDYVNKRWFDYTSLSEKDSLGRGVWLKVLHPDDVQRTLDRWRFSVKHGDFFEIEYRIRSGNNDTYRWFLGQGVPMRDEQGNIIKWFGTCTDIEDHKRAEEELVEKNLELERINQDLDSFVYTASHDLKLPIVNMVGIFEELIQSAEFKDADAPHMIELFNKSFKQLHATIHDLGEVVRVQKTKERNLEELNLQEVCEDVLVSVQEIIRHSGASIQFDFSEAPTVPFTRASLKSMVYNLITNALKYRAHDRAPEIKLRSLVRNNYIELQVQDNGLGLDLNKQQSKLFQMFKRFHNHVEGSGLGLYIVNRLLTNHGGYIHIESELDKGTTFYLYFKRKKA
ncbi:PAS domain-containing protein [Pontibacter akesuensis]|uniref:histidine kinase n=1 Tax=Pontibacter akesuensis TaxID=388950 RepID=A0A1I7IEE8_9BACT|nr:PAS domain-containing protein [Pontibacter akesuensis]GHA66809.1 hypothetical protein GCM10007389_19860 [Pontibacter akesuensis]SFU71363.1 PAS domain S-box-containing protein [Pontibacter akesuensis]